MKSTKEIFHTYIIIIGCLCVSIGMLSLQAADNEIKKEIATMLATITPQESAQGNNNGTTVTIISKTTSRNTLCETIEVMADNIIYPLIIIKSTPPQGNKILLNFEILSTRDRATKYQPTLEKLGLHSQSEPLQTAHELRQTINTLQETYTTLQQSAMALTAKSIDQWHKQYREFIQQSQQQISLLNGIDALIYLLAIKELEKNEPQQEDTTP